MATEFLHPVVECFADEIFHDIEVSEVGDLAKVIVYADDVWIGLGNGAGQLNFSFKPFFHPRQSKDIGFDDFDHAFGVAFEADVLSLVNQSKTPLGKLTYKAVFVCDQHHGKAAFKTACGGFVCGLVNG